MARAFRIKAISDESGIRRKLRRFLAGEVGPRRREGDSEPVHVISAEKVVRELTRERKETEEPVYRLRRYTIEGDFSLKHRVVEVAVEIQDCVFRDAVDFSYCEFKQVVNLSGCTFHKTVKSGGDLEAYTVYRKDLICNGTVFEKDVSLSGARVEGDAHFSRILSEGRVCNTHFKDKLDLSSFKCSGYGFFKGTRFEGESGIDFSYASFGRSLDCRGAVFSATANFWSVRCNDSAYFMKARFRSTKTILNDYAVRFGRASFGEQLHCELAVFKGPVEFYAMTCSGTAFFEKARFLYVGEGKPRDERNLKSKKPAAEFTAAYFGKQLDCTGTVFMGAVSFNAIECAGEGSFKEAYFQGDEHDFRHASVERSLRFNSCTFLGRTTDFRYARVGGNLGFQYVYCETDFKLGHANITYKLRFEGSRFMDKVSLYNTRIGILELLNNHPSGTIKVRTDSSPELHYRSLFKNDNAVDELCKKRRTKQGKEEWKNKVKHLYPFKGFEELSLNLADIRFERFHAGSNRQLANELALKFARGQVPRLFRRDPFLQLERFFQNDGNETEARTIYCQGRIAYRDNAKDENGNVDWSRSKWLADSLWKFLTGYGVAPYRLLGLAFAFLGLGTFLFYAPDVIEAYATAHFPKDSGTFIAAHVPSHALDPATTSVEPKSWQEGLHYRAAYSLDLFLPLVNLHVDEKWQPHGPVLQVYAVVHAVIGWLVVPLLVAALAGVMRR